MKVLFSLTYYLPYISGLSIHVQKVAEGLEKRGYKVRILTSQHDKSLKKDEAVNEVAIVRVPYLVKFHKGLFMPTWLLAGAREVSWADIIICNLPQPEGLFLLLFARLLKKKAIIVYHCDINLPKGFLNFLAEKFLFFINYLSCQLCSGIISTSKDYASHSLILRKFTQKTFYMFPPVKDLTSLRISLKEKEELAPLFRGVQYKIGFVGRVAADKGVEFLLETIPYLRKHLRSFKIFLVGPREAVGEQEYVKKINLLSKTYKENVSFLGTLSDNQLAWFYRNIDVFVLPSVNSTEAFGTVQVEAMLFGVPVVASDLPGVRVPIKLTKMGELASSRSPSSISDAIVRISKNRENYAKDKNIFYKVKKPFLLDKVIDNYEKIIKI